MAQMTDFTRPSATPSHWPSRLSICKRSACSTRCRPLKADIPILLKQALEKVAFLPFGLLIDQWRWKVFSGEINPEDYNKSWWDLHLKYHGLAPMAARGAEVIDPGAKYHVRGNVPYARYFLAFILQFQLNRALSQGAN